MLAIGNDEMDEPLGDLIDCIRCGNAHPIEYGQEIMPDGSKVTTKLLSFYTCQGNSYLAGIRGMKIKTKEQS